MSKSFNVPGVDLTHRPASYFWPLGLEAHLLATIKGAERKAALKHLIDAGRLDEVPDWLTRSALSNEERQATGRLHPAFMGGEYLPNLSSREVEIARITIASVAQDVTSVYARRGKNRISYRVVDEYGGDTLSERQTRTSKRPLTLGKLEIFFSGAWSIFDVLEMNFGDAGYGLDEMLRFVSVDSQFYPQIGELYERRITEWAAVRRRESGLHGEEDGNLEPRAATSNGLRQDALSDRTNPSQGVVAQALPVPPNSVRSDSELRAKPAGSLSIAEGAAYSSEEPWTVSLGYFRTPDGKPPKER